MKIVRTISSNTIFILYEQDEEVKQYYTDKDRLTFHLRNKIPLKPSERVLYTQAWKYEI